MEEPRTWPLRTGHYVEHNSASGHARVHYGDQYNVTYHAQQASSVHEQFLASLWFESIDERRNSIKSPAPATLRWIYDAELMPDHNTWQMRPHWDSFTGWLLNGNSTYWICGKAGSGKSTLMSRLVDDERTVELLEQWSLERSLHVLSFFFWRPGNPLQNSVIGMLRSLLYQLCEQNPPIIDELTVSPRQRKLGLTVWSEENLKASVSMALKSSPDSYCIFIDGLDEYTGPCDTLMDLISEIQDFDNVKCCVASRPEVELSVRLSDCRQLRLENLNHTDIFAYTTRRLSSLVRAPALALYSGPKYQVGLLRDELVRRASGVFLWVVLAIPSILKGANSGDDLEMLMGRLRSLPPEMSDLYAHMIASIDPVHRKSLDFYFNIMWLQSDAENSFEWILTEHAVFPRITDIVAAQLLDDGCFKYAIFQRRCGVEALKIISQSAGLLEVTSIPEQFEDPEAMTTSVVHYIPDLVEGRSGSGEICTDQIKAVKARRSHGSQGLHSISMRYEYARIQWAHRSAHEFVFPSDGSPSPVQHLTSDYVTVRRQLWRGALRFITFGPSAEYETYPFWSLTSRRVRRLVMSLCIGMQTDPDGAMQTLSALHCVVQELDPRETCTLY